MLIQIYMHTHKYTNEEVYSKELLLTKVEWILDIFLESQFVSSIFIAL